MIRFQFHKGTIKPLVFGERGVFLHGFQFHKGTIKPFSTFADVKEYLSFNSIKVRLNRYADPRNGSLLFGFNSIKVRLNHMQQGGHYIVWLFQFHKGTIKPL